jgi:hypothetical protein
VRWSPLPASASTATRGFRPATLVWPVLLPIAEIALYYAVPLDHDFTARTIGWLAIGLVAFALIVYAQVTQTAKSPYPRVRAVIALLTSIPVFLLMFSATYYLAARTAPHNFNESMTRTDALYFATTVFSTVGFGDIVPKTEVARVLVMFQMLGDLIVIGLLGRVIVSAVGVGLQRRGAPVVTATERSSSAADDER